MSFFVSLIGDPILNFTSHSSQNDFKPEIFNRKVSIWRFGQISKISKILECKRRLYGGLGVRG